VAFTLDEISHQVNESCGVDDVVVVKRIIQQ
jgi:hypothetical protein